MEQYELRYVCKSVLPEQRNSTQYTQQAVDLMNQDANSNPQGIQSLFSKIMGSL